MKMLGNSAADAIGGLVPMVGDLFDFAFKSNRRNARLLMDYLDAQSAPPAAPSPAAKWRALAVSGLFLLAAIGLILWIWSLLLGGAASD